MAKNAYNGPLIMAVAHQPGDLSVLERLIAAHMPRCELITARSAEDGLSLAASRRPDVAVVEMRMPGIDGIEMTRRLKADPAAASCVVLLTADHGTAAALRDEALDAGAEGFICKPVDGAGLVAAVRLALRARGAETAERELPERSRISQMILDALPCVALLVSPDTRQIVACNEAGRKVGAVPGTTCFATWAKRKAPCPWCLAPEAWQDGEPQHVEVEYEGVIWDIHWYRVADDLYLHYAFDITDRKQLEQRLCHAVKMEAVGRLAGGVAHDFRNQLTVVKGYCQLLLKKLSGDDELRDPVEQISAAADRATTTTDYLLAFSLKKLLRPEAFDLNEAVMSLRNPLSKLLGEDIEISVRSDACRAVVEADRTQLDQAVVNLAVNARDAMPSGGVLTLETATVLLTEADIRLHPDIDPGPYVMLAVSDTGTGMDERTRGTVFEPFFTTKEIGKGTGLGLSMVYSFVRQSGGQIDVESELGKGTTFRFYLPRVGELVEAPDELPPSDAMPTGSETILVVEDEDAVRRIVTHVLRECGYTVLEAGNAAEALPLGEHYDGSIHLLITDVVMPGMNGRELARRIRAVRPDVRVLLISGYDQAIVAGGASPPENTRLMMKPFDPHDLVQMARNMLDSAVETNPRASC